MKRGEIYYIKSSYSESGFEIKGSRPGVIVSNNKCNERSGCLEVVFLTTQPKKNLPTHVLVRQDTARPSTVLCEQITTVDEEMREVDKALVISLGLPVPGETFAQEPELDNTAEEEATIYDELWIECNKLTAELDIYKQLYESLLDKITR